MKYTSTYREPHLRLWSSGGYGWAPVQTLHRWGRRGGCSLSLPIGVEIAADDPICVAHGCELTEGERLRTPALCFDQLLWAHALKNNIFMYNINQIVRSMLSNSKRLKEKKGLNHVLKHNNELCSSPCLPRCLFLYLSRDIIRSVARFRLLAHTLRIETVAWTHDTSSTGVMCNAKIVQDEQHLILCTHPHLVSLRRAYASLFHPTGFYNVSASLSHVAKISSISSFMHFSVISRLAVALLHRRLFLVNYQLGFLLNFSLKSLTLNHGTCTGLCCPR